MSRSADNQVDYRAINRQALFEAAATAVSKHCPHLTDGQKKRLALYIADADPCYAPYRDERGWPCPSQEELEGQLRALEQLKLPDADVYRVAPSVGELTSVLIAAEPNAVPTTKLNIQRAVARMGPDARLEASKNIDMTKAAKTPAATAQAAPKEITSEEKRRGVYCEEDRLLEEKGHDLRSMQPSKRRSLHALVRQEMAPKGTPAIDEAKSKIAAGGQLTNIEKLNVTREAAVLGKTPREMGLPF